MMQKMRVNFMVVATIFIGGYVHASDSYNVKLTNKTSCFDIKMSDGANLSVVAQKNGGSIEILFDADSASFSLKLEDGDFGCLSDKYGFGDYSFTGSGIITHEYESQNYNGKTCTVAARVCNLHNKEGQFPLYAVSFLCNDDPLYDSNYNAESACTDCESGSNYYIEIPSCF